MSITPFGYIFFLILFLTIALSVRVNKRMSKERGSPNGCFGSVFVGLVVVLVTSLFIGSVVAVVLHTYSLATYPKYKSTIVDVHSEWVERDYTDDDGFTRTESVEMHTAVLEFYDGDNKLIRRNNNIRSGSKPKIGEEIIIAYRDGKLKEFSLRSILLVSGVAVMMVLLGSISVGIVLYAFNKNTERVHKFGWGVVFYFVIPSSMILMMCVMLYALWGHHVNSDNMSIGVQVLLIFFSITLFLSLTGYIKTLLQKEHKESQKK